MGSWFSAHSHSRYSIKDGMGGVGDMVAKAVRLGQPALGLTDHGNLAGAVQLYTECKKAGIVPFPGFEGYLIDPRFTGELESKEGKDSKLRKHLGMLALNVHGYQGLVKFVTQSYTRPRFHMFPRFTIDDLAAFSAEYGDDVAVMTGCFFGHAQQLINAGQAQQASDYIEVLADMFAHTFVEVQHHNIVHTEDPDATAITDTDMVDSLVDIADALGLPILATQDCHYIDQKQKSAHALMKRMVYGGSDDEFPGDSFHLASEEWVGEHYAPDVWAGALEGSRELLSLNTLDIPHLNTFKTHVPTVHKAANARLARLAKESLERMMSDGRTQPRKRKAYDARIAYELGVIKKLGQANYILICNLVAEYCEREQICIEVRGSANGSLILFLLGVTTVDPIVWGTIFDRFLSLDRIKPPDVDFDVEDVSRDKLVKFIATHMDQCQIGTFGTLGSQIDDEGVEKGSVVATYRTYLVNELKKEYDAERKAAAEAAGTRNTPRNIAREQQFAEDKRNVYAMVKDMADVDKYFHDDVTDLRRLARLKPYKSAGTHASGILLSGDDLKINDWIPQMLAVRQDKTKELMVSQFDMDDVEKWGLVKLDILGQIVLTAMRMCQQLMGRPNPRDFSWIPKDDPATTTLMRKGLPYVTGIFHLEGYTKAKGGRELQIKTTRDSILMQALYMPGATGTGQKDLYIARRRDPSLRSRVKYPHPIFEEELGSTYGTVVFQEQVLNIMRKMGMDMGTINALFKVLKDSGAGAVQRNAARLIEIRTVFNDACDELGIVDPDGAWTWLTGIVSYAFNYNHAAGYGIRTYRCAYLKAHHPLEFMTSLMAANAGKAREANYVQEARRMELAILPPHVNISTDTWTIDRRMNGIRKGLKSIPGIGEAAARTISASAPFADMVDLCERVDGRGITGKNGYLKDRSITGTLKALVDAGATKGLAP